MGSQESHLDCFESLDSASPCWIPQFRYLEGSLGIRAVLSDYIESGLESGFLFQLQGLMGQGEATRPG